MIIRELNSEVRFMRIQGLADPDYSGPLNLPETIRHEGKTWPVTSIWRSAFSGKTGLTGSLKIPKYVTEIGAGAFNGCSGLHWHLSLPEGLTSIGEAAFSHCESLVAKKRLGRKCLNISSFTTTQNECTRTLAICRQLHTSALQTLDA